MLTIKTTERRQQHHPRVFIVTFERFSPFSSVPIVDFHSTGKCLLRAAEKNMPQGSSTDYKI